MIREIVTIDEQRCDGCGQCVPACHEGALRIVDGKAKLVSDIVCDGLGACLGHCPQDAIKIVRREAAPFDLTAVAAQRTDHSAEHQARACPGALPALTPSGPSGGGGCPGSRLMTFDPAEQHVAETRPRNEPSPTNRQSELTHWPVQLRLLPPTAPVLQGARLLIAADCVPVACADFHTRLLRGHAVALGCPKFDDLEGSIQKIEAMMRVNDLHGITVARMDVPCCQGILHAVLEARRQAASDVPVNDIVVNTRGKLIAQRAL
ncbi:MAG: 4Fe-4S binding protein [Planctomycetes bacterium]|nr:4Fe-4S binding protein [Planctomycetota bacterium]